jgi:hypothetical protein
MNLSMITKAGYVTHPMVTAAGYKTHPVIN